jgi:archaellum component FlaG (FlaF/FlaG flagellin family)
MVKYLVAIAKASKLLVVVLTVAAFALAALTLGAITVTQNVSSSGVVTDSNIGVYSDSGCTTNMTSINWGSVAAGGTATQTVYVKDTGTGAMTLSLAVSNWSPSGASTYITISWNKQGTQLSAGQSVAATLTLTVSSSVTGITSFSNTITISGTG